MTALYTAIKIHEPKFINLSLLAELGRGIYCEQDFKRMEVDLLSSLTWRLAGPTAITFLEHYIVLLSLESSGIPIDDVLQNAHYQIELSVIDYGHVGTSPSKAAAAALIRSINTVTASTELASRRSKALKALQNICEIDLGSVCLRNIRIQMARNEGLQNITCRRNSALPCFARIRSGSISMKGSQSCSPRKVSN